MHMPHLIDVVAEVFRSHGYRVTLDAKITGPQGDEHEVPLQAVKDGRSVVVETWLDEQSPPAAQVDTLLSLAQHAKADAALLINLGDPIEAAAPNLIVWDRNRVQAELGEAVLNETCPGLIERRDPLEARVPPAPEAPADVMAPAAPEAQADLDLLGMMPLDDEPAPAQPEIPAAAAATAQEEEGDFEMLPGRLDEPQPEAAPEPAPAAASLDDDGGAQILPGRSETPKPAPLEAFARDDGAEILPGRSTAAPTSEPKPTDLGFELLPSRSAQATPAAPTAAAKSASTAGFEILPNRGRDEAAKWSAPPVPPLEDYEILPAKGEAKPPTERLEVPVAFRAEAAASPPGVLQLQVGRKLARNLVKGHLKSVTEQTLRLHPHFVFGYQADLLVDGRLDAETRQGFIAVDAAVKRALEWPQAPQTGPLDAEGAPVEEKKVRCDVEEARRLAAAFLGDSVHRDVTMEEESDEWSVVVRKEVRLDPSEVDLAPMGLFWAPVWRLVGPEGSVEIDASNGQVLSQDVITERSDAQLL